MTQVDHFNPHFEYLRLNCQGYSQSEYQAGMFGGEGAASVKYKAQDHAFKCAPDLTVRPYPGQSHFKENGEN